MKLLLGVLMLVSFYSNAQIIQAVNRQQSTGIGVHWEESLSWEGVKEKAKREGKYIFVDCFATWCAPCKMMDKNIYVSEKIGSIVNEKFIAVKIQFDKVKSDNEFVKSWYNVADELNQKYNISAFPTFLFFTPEGEIVHRDFGYKNYKEFIELTNVALDTQKQFYRRLNEYQAGKRDLDFMKRLAIDCKSFGNEKLGIQIAEEYIKLLGKNELFTKDGILFMYNFKKSNLVKDIVEDYKSNILDKLDEETLSLKANLDFISKFPELVNAKDKYFHLLYTRSDKVDSILKIRGFANKVVSKIIIKDEIYSIIFKDNKSLNKVNWKRIKRSITNKYNSDYAESLVLEVQPLVYKKIGDWEGYSRVIEKRIKMSPPSDSGKNYSLFGDAWGLNIAAWDVFKYCNNKNILRKALRWSDLSIELDKRNSKPTPQLLDTRANLLYKLGKVLEGIEQEEKAIEVDINNAKDSGRGKSLLFDEFTETLNKMKLGEPTWPK